MVDIDSGSGHDQNHNSDDDIASVTWRIIISSLEYYFSPPPDYFVLEHEEHRWLQSQQQQEEEMSGNDNTTTVGDGANGGGGNDTLATFSAVMTNLLLFFLVFCLSATVNLKDLKNQLSNKFAIGAGVAMQFVFMPLLGFISVCIFNSVGYTQAMGVSLLVVTASPGGSYSNWWCSLFNASLALSVGVRCVCCCLDGVA
jgi:Sodium Bile acid symporter family